MINTTNADKSNAPIGGIYFLAGDNKGSVIDINSEKTGF